jgi:homoserine kinase
MRLRLPATSANLGAAFDAAAVALDIFLEIEAESGQRGKDGAAFSLSAEGRNAAQCEAVKGNLLLETYTSTLAAEGRENVPLSLQIKNAIPLGMGLGSSAAARLAGVALAAHFGKLAWDKERILQEVCLREGHPDNAAACWLGGFVTSATDSESHAVLSACFSPPEGWHAVVVLPETPVATARARSVLPEMVSRADAVANVQRAALLTAAFAQGRGDWLREAMADRLHQRHRVALCPMLARMLPMAGQHGILGIALSGAGPGVLCLVEFEAARSGELEKDIRKAAGEPVEILRCALTGAGGRESYSAKAEA